MNETKRNTSTSIPGLNLLYTFHICPLCMAYGHELVSDVHEGLRDLLSIYRCCCSNHFHEILFEIPRTILVECTKEEMHWMNHANSAFEVFPTTEHCVGFIFQFYVNFISILTKLN